MKNRLVRLGAFVATIISMFATATPAEALSESGALFTGTANTGPLGYPCTPSTSNCPPPIGGGGNTVGFSLMTTTCLGFKINILSPKTTTGSGPSCSINAAGVISGYCGLASGFGSATITYSGIATYTLGASFTIQSVAGTLVLTGTASNGGTLEGFIEAVPDPNGGSCASNSATRFILVGAIGVSSPTG